MLGYFLMLASTCTSLAEGILIKQYNKKYAKGGFLFTALVSVFGLIFFVVRNLSGLHWQAALLPYALTAVSLIIAGIVIDKRDCLTILKKGGPYAAVAGIANGATNMLGMLVNTMVAISIATPTRSALKSVISFLVSLFVFKETFEKRQIMGVLLGALAVVLLNLSI